MKRKHRSRMSPDPSHPWTQRLAEIWKRVWRGNKSEMARSLGVSNQVIMRILSGQQLPTAKVLESIATNPEINMRWLITGEGEPLIEPGAQAGAERFRPIVDDLLPGPPSDHRDCFSGVGYPVTEGFDSTTSYWYRVPEATALICKKEPVRAGDLLLMETDSKWTRNSNALEGKYAGFLVRTKKGNRVVLGKVDVMPDADSYFDESVPQKTKVETFGEFEAALLVVPTPKAKEMKSTLLAASEPHPKAVPAEPTKHGKELELGLDNVVCVCCQLIRGFHRTRGRG